MIFSISVSLLRFQTSFFFFFFKQTNMVEQEWAGRGGLAMEQGAAATGTVDSVLGLETEIGVERPRF